MRRTPKESQGRKTTRKQAGDAILNVESNVMTQKITRIPKVSSLDREQN